MGLEAVLPGPQNALYVMLCTQLRAGAPAHSHFLIIIIRYINLYSEPGIEATACARELLYVYVYVSIVIAVINGIEISHNYLRQKVHHRPIRVRNCKRWAVYISVAH